MAFIQLSAYSHTLHIGVNVYVISPEKGAEPSKVLYLLHGLAGDHTDWVRKTSIERYASKYGLTVVMPAAGRSFYTDQKQGYNYYTYVSKELPEIIGKIFNVSQKREDTYIAGLSMGGYGAMKIALANPEKYSMAASFSGALDIVERFKMDTSQELINSFGEEGPTGIDDTMDLLEKCEVSIRPRLYQSCGTKDRLHPLNLNFKEKALSLGYDLTYSEEPETHNWRYWDRQINEALIWMFEDQQP